MTAPERTRNKLLPMAAAALAIVLGVLGLLAYLGSRALAPKSGAEAFAHRGAPAASALAPLWAAPRFSFHDQHDQPFTRDSLAGHVWIGDFIFTTCTSVCPLITAKMVLLQRKLDDPALLFVSFSVDPEHDHPAVLADYAKSWNANETRWTLLSTDVKGLADVAQQMRVAVEPSNDPQNPILHSSLFFLVDGAGNVRGFYDSADSAAIARLVDDARTLLGKHAPSRKERSPRSAEALTMELGCPACHENPKLAPSLAGLAGRVVQFTDGGHAVADADYLREALLAPGKRVVAGYVNLMPSYADELSPAEVDALVHYVQSLPVAAAPSNAPKRPIPPAVSGAPAAATPATAPATLAVDPVCHMQVRTAGDTPSATHAGHTYYFCSDSCKKRFVENPTQYVPATP